MVGWVIEKGINCRVLINIYVMKNELSRCSGDRDDDKFPVAS